MGVNIFGHRPTTRAQLPGRLCATGFQYTSGAPKSIPTQTPNAGQVSYSAGLGGRNSIPELSLDFLNKLHC